MKNGFHKFAENERRAKKAYEREQKRHSRTALRILSILGISFVLEKSQENRVVTEKYVEKVERTLQNNEENPQNLETNLHDTAFQNSKD